MTFIPGEKRCPKCQNQANITSWKPRKGYDQSMRKYQCASCHFSFYTIRVSRTTLDPHIARLLELEEKTK